MPFSHEECEIIWNDEMEFRINPSARGLLISNSKSTSKQNLSLSLRMDSQIYFPCAFLSLHTHLRAHKEYYSQFL